MAKSELQRQKVVVRKKDGTTYVSHRMKKVPKGTPSQPPSPTPQPGGTRIVVYPGRNSDRQSVGLPGHCEQCAEHGHIVAHPEYGCSEVGCYSSHENDPTPTSGVPAYAGKLETMLVRDGVEQRVVAYTRPADDGFTLHVDATRGKVPQVTVDVPGTPPNEGCVWVKSWGDSRGMVKALAFAGIAYPTGRTAEVGGYKTYEARVTQSLLPEAPYTPEEREFFDGSGRWTSTHPGRYSTEIVTHPGGYSQMRAERNPDGSYTVHVDFTDEEGRWDEGIARYTRPQTPQGETVTFTEMREVFLEYVYYCAVNTANRWDQLPE